MSSTTLMTFLLTTTPNVRSVKLLGSWDNFSKPYAMERDKRVGAGQWRGCHKFTDIICDGSADRMHEGRTGGLKMGGTYWYYYLLDDDVEYCNHAEPVTSHCPFLPGQPVNVLHVPIILPDSLPTHTHTDSTNSQKPEYRTMNPEDKYMNPRQPPKPRPTRIQTSASPSHHAIPTWSFNPSPLDVIITRTASQPNPSAAKFRARDVRGATGSKTARSVSPPRGRGLRAALRYLNSSSPDLRTAHRRAGDGEHQASASSPVRPRADSHGSDSSYEDTSHPRVFKNEFGLAPPASWSMEAPSTDRSARRRPVSAGYYEPSSLTIRDRRALRRSKSRDSSPRRQPLILETRPRATSSSHSSLVTAMPANVGRASSPNHNSPAIPSAEELTISVDPGTPTPYNFADKRLPTLPNTPSSVMDEALRDLEDREKAMDTEALGSHFSDFSATDESSDDTSPYDRSHFSEWSVDADAVARDSSMEPLPTLNAEQQHTYELDSMDTPELSQSGLVADGDDPDTPLLMVNSRASPATSVAGDSPRMNGPPPHVTGPLSPSDLDIPGLCIDDTADDDVETNPKRHAAFFRDMDFSQIPNDSTIAFPEGNEEDLASAHDRDPAELAKRYSRLSQAQFAGQSATMQEMMNELSYLKNMIQAGNSI